jgi:O-antigen/teichoic acid export membrane protein
VLSARVIATSPINAMLVPAFGMLGAAAATATCQIGLYGGACLLVRSRLGLWPLARGGMVAVLAGGVTMVLGLSMSTLIASDSIWMDLGVAIAAIGVLYTGIVASKLYGGDMQILRGIVEMRTKGAAAGTDRATGSDG